MALLSALADVVHGRITLLLLLLDGGGTGGDRRCRRCHGRQRPVPHGTTVPQLCLRTFFVHRNRSLKCNPDKLGSTLAFMQFCFLLRFGVYITSKCLV